MTTYNTYQAAKIANPDSEIYQLERNGAFAHCDYHKAELVRFVEFDSAGIKCNPADYCMTVEKFLADGHKFVEGDVVFDFGDVVSVDTAFDVETYNKIDKMDDRRYILRAAALEEKKPRTKVEYVQVLDCIFNLKSDYENGNLYHSYDGKEFSEIKGDERTVARCLVECNLYRRIETPMTWQEELYDYLDSSCEMSDDFDDSFTIEIKGRPLEFNLNDDEFVDMCKLVASLNSVN